MKQLERCKSAASQEKRRPRGGGGRGSTTRAKECLLSFLLFLSTGLLSTTQEVLRQTPARTLATCSADTLMTSSLPLLANHMSLFADDRFNALNGDDVFIAIEQTVSTSAQTVRSDAGSRHSVRSCMHVPIATPTTPVLYHPDLMQYIHTYAPVGHTGAVHHNRCSRERCCPRNHCRCRRA